MPLRLVIAYALIAALAAGGAFALWHAVLREQWARRLRRFRRARRLGDAGPRPTSNGHQPVFETD